MRYLMILITAIFLTGAINAQISFGISLNLSNQPAWGPVGYDNAEYYYLPDIEAYYSIPLHRFYFNERGRWVGRSSLPYRYRNYDLYRSYKVVVNDRRPWQNHNSYREKYASYRDRRDQEPIRDSRDSKYFANRNHPEHNNWVKQQRQERNRQNAIKNNRNDGYGNNKNKSIKQNSNDKKQDKGKNKR